MKASTSNYSVILEDQFPTFGSTEVRQKVITLPRFSSSIVCVRISHQQNVINARAFQLLEEISYLSDDWDCDGGVAPKTETIIAATTFVAALQQRGQEVYHVAPGPDGEVLIDLRNIDNSRILEILFYSTRKVYVKSEDGDFPTQGFFSYSILPEILDWLNS